SGALNESRPDDCSVRSSISTRRVSTKVASPDLTPASSAVSAPRSNGSAARTERGASAAGPTSASTATKRRRSGAIARCGRLVGIGPEVEEVEPVVRRLAAQRLEGRDVTLQAGTDRRVALARGSGTDAGQAAEVGDLDEAQIVVGAAAI